jgi:hypothetical protein
MTGHGRPEYPLTINGRQFVMIRQRCIELENHGYVHSEVGSNQPQQQPNEVK